MAYKAAYFLAAFGFVGMVIVQGCGNDKGDDGANLPGRNKDGGSDGDVITPADSGGSSGTSGTPAADCSGVTEKFSDNPTCDACTKSKCCKEALACQNSADCKALNACLAKCADSDQTCILTCSAEHDNGTALAEDVGSCAQANCSTECASSVPEGGPGFDF